MKRHIILFFVFLACITGLVFTENLSDYYQTVGDLKLRTIYSSFETVFAIASILFAFWWVGEAIAYEHDRDLKKGKL